MEGTFDTDTDTLTWTVTYSGLSSPAVAAHFHGPISYLGLTPEENAPIQVGTPGNLASPFHGVAKIDDTQAKDLKDGRWYFNLHSKDSPPAKFADPSSTDEGLRPRVHERVRIRGLTRLRFSYAADAEAGKRIFQTVCHQCHAALPDIGRISVENLPKFLANPRRYKPTTAMTFPGLRSKKDIEDVIAYITANQ